MLGAGNFGTAVAGYINFPKLGFELIGCFDTDKEKIGRSIGKLVIMDEAELDSFCRAHRVDTAILCIPKQNVENSLERLYRQGVKSYWNFSHFDITSKHKDVVVENVHLSDSLMTLCYRITNAGEQQ